jgi:MFS family permease
MVHEYVPAGSRSLANGWVTCAACAGIAATYYGLGALMDRFGWPSAFLACSLATFVVACVWTAGTRGRAGAPGPAPGDPRTPQAARGMLDMLTRKGVLCLTVSYAALGYFQYVFFYWIEYYFETIQGQSVDVARRYTTLITLAMGVGMVAGGWIADRLPRSLPGRARRALVPVAGLVGSGLAFEAGVYSSSAAATVAAFMLASALIGSCEGPFWTTVVEMGRPYGGTAAGLMNTGGNAGGTLSPWVTPLLGSFFAAHVGEADGWRMGLAVAGLVPILGAVLWWGVEAAERDPAAVAEAAARG